jgi:DNA-binding SARP family transcriptional activator
VARCRSSVIRRSSFIIRHSSFVIRRQIRTMTALELTLLGTLHVARGDEPVRHFQSDKVRALLAYLATEADRSHARASLAALLWPEQSDQAALRNLSQTLVRLREVLGHSDQRPAPLRITAQSIQWLPNTTEVDVTAFVQLARSADPQDLARAAALYQGEFLAGFALPGCEAFEEWLLVSREQFQQQVLTALHTLAEHYLARQRWADAAAAARRQIELDRWREDAHRQLMRAIAGTGDRAAALAAYQRCKQILHDDLSITPDAATIALAAAIRSGTIAGTDTPSPARSSAAAEAVAPRPTLPSPLSPLIGREGEQARIETLLRDGRTRLLTIIGVGGAGKTRLALAAA